jgi:sugar-phosphatase
LLAASRLGKDPKCCVVFEDAAAGILAGEASGAKVVVISATHTEEHGTAHFTASSFQHLKVETDCHGDLILGVRRGRH